MIKDFQSMMRFLRIAGLSIGCCLATKSLLAQSLDEMVGAFVEKSPYVSQQRHRLEQAQMTAKQEMANILPTLGVQAELTQDPEERLFDRDVMGERYSLVLRQPIFGGSANYYHWRAARDARDSTAADVETSIQDLKLELIVAYVDVLASQDVVEQQRRQVTVLKDQLEVVRARFEGGAAIASDLRQAEARLAASEGRRALAESQLEQAEANLSRLSGFNKPFRLQWPVAPEELPQNVEQLYKEALQTNPAIRANEAAVAQQSSLQQATRMQFLPEIAAEYRRTESRDPLLDERTRQDVLAIGIQLNLFNGLRNYHQSGGYEAAGQQQLAQLEMLKRQLKLESETVLSRHRAAKSNLSSLEVAVRSAEEASRAFELEYQNGTRALTDVLSAEQDLLAARVGLVEARATYLLSYYRIRWVMGQL